MNRDELSKVPAHELVELVIEQRESLAKLVAQRDTLIREAKFLTYYEIPDDAVERLSSDLDKMVTDPKIRPWVDDALTNIEQLQTQKARLSAELKSIRDECAASAAEELELVASWLESRFDYGVIMADGIRKKSYKDLHIDKELEKLK